MHWLDITLLVILAIFALIGLKRGLINAILSLFSTFASGFIAWWVAKPFAGFIENVFHVTKYLVEFSSKTLISWSASFGEAVAEATTGGAVISSSGLSTWQQVILKIVVGENTVIQAGETPAGVFANIIAPVILIVLAGIVAFILIKIAVFLLSKLFDALKKNHAINGMDKVLGLVLGLVKGALLICIAMGVTIFIPNEKIIAEIDKTTITKVAYEPVTTFIRDNVADKLRAWAEQIMPKQNNNTEEQQATETSYKISVYSDSVIYKD